MWGRFDSGLIPRASLARALRDNRRCLREEWRLAPGGDAKPPAVQRARGVASDSSIRQHTAMNKIFLSYRREDSADIAGRIFDHLERRFGRERLFIDVDSIRYGEDFRRCIDAKSTGAVRVSLGLATTFEDVYRFMQFVRGFVDENGRGTSG